jgi:hypothetical protein
MQVRMEGEIDASHHDKKKNDVECGHGLPQVSIGGTLPSGCGIHHDDFTFIPVCARSLRN